MPVVMEKRLIYQLSEVLSVIIRCLHCQAEVHVKDFFIGPETRSRAFDANQCPHCGKTWKADTHAQEKDQKAAKKLFDALHYFTNEEYQLRLEKGEVLRDFKLELPAVPN